MPKLSKLDEALRVQIKSLDGVQAEMVKSEIATWKWNKNRILSIEMRLDTGKNEEEPSEALDNKERTELINERHKLVTENTSLYSHINRALKGTEVQEQDELGEFCFGK